MAVTSPFIWYPEGVGVGSAYDLRKVINFAPAPGGNMLVRFTELSTESTVVFDATAFEAAMQTAADAGEAVSPVNITPPVISGSGVEGEPLSCWGGSWTSNAPLSYAFQWENNGSPIGGATSSIYIPVAGDVGDNITCDVTVTNYLGSATETSNTIVPTAAP